MTFHIGLLIVAGLLTIAALPVIHRIIVGPSILDRALASDMLVVLLVMAFAVYSADSGTTYAFSAMLALTALAFLATVAVARFVAREDTATARQVKEGQARAHPAPGSHAADAEQGSER